MAAEVLPRAMVSTAVDVATDTRATTTVTPSNEAYVVIQTSTDAGVTFADASTPTLYRSETDVVLTSLANDTQVRAKFFGGIGTCTVDIVADTP